MKLQMPEGLIPNLDCEIDAKELLEFKDSCREIENTLRDLGSYAEAKAKAMILREQGRISLAKRFEDAADLVYEKLPTWTAW